MSHTDCIDESAAIFCSLSELISTRGVNVNAQTKHKF